jgi:tetratricopeptide (TPR) repeat protein
VEELLRSWVAVGALEPDGTGSERGWRLNVPVARLAIPSTVHAIYAAQIDDLPGGARAVVRRASVAGREFPRDALPALDVLNPEPALAALVAGQVLSGPRADTLSGDQYAYRHALLREAGYASLARAERARLHVRLARWLEGAGGERLDDLAEVIGGHYAAGLEAAPALAGLVGDGLDKPTTARLAAAWLERGGRRARQLGAVAAARDLLERALLLTPPDELLPRADRLVLLGEATAATADMDEAARRLEEALALYRSLLEGRTDVATRRSARTGLAEAIERLGRVWFEQVNFVRARELATAAIAEIGPAPDRGPDVPRARLLLLHAKADHAETDADTSGPLDEVLAIAREAGERRLELDALVARAVVRIELGLPDPEGFGAVERLATELGEWSTIVSSLINRSLGLTDEHAADAILLLDEAYAIAEARGMLEQMAWSHYVRAEALVVTGDVDATRQACERALALADRNAYRRVAIRTYHLLVAIAGEWRDPDPGRRVTAFWAEFSGQLPDSPYARIMRAALDVWIATAEGRTIPAPEVEPRLHSFDIPHSSPSWLLGVEAVVTSWVQTGELAGAREAVRRMTAMSGHPETSELARGTIDLLASRLALAGGEGAQAVEGARSALRRFRSIPAPWWTAKSLQALELANGATDAEKAELAEIRNRLGLPSL